MSIKHSKRKLIKVGNSSAVTVPSDWVEDNKITDDNRDLHALYNNVLVIFPPDFPIEKRHELEMGVLRLEGNEPVIEV